MTAFTRYTPQITTSRRKRRSRRRWNIPRLLDSIIDKAELVEALDIMTERYASLANSGDCGNWDPEEEEEVIQARAALKRHKEG